MFRSLLLALTVLSLLFSISPAMADDVPVPPSPTSTATPAPTPIPLAEIATAAEAADLRLKESNNRLADTHVSKDVEEKLPLVSKEIDSRVAETKKILDSSATLDALGTLEGEWRRIAGDVSSWKTQLTKHAQTLDKEVAQLASIEELWQQALELATHENAPRDVIERVRYIQQTARTTKVLAERERGKTLTLQNRLVQEDARVAAGLSSVTATRDRAVGKLFARDRAPLWDVLRGEEMQTLVSGGQESWGMQLVGLRSYLSLNMESFIFHLLFFGLFILIMKKARSAVESWASEEPGTDRAVAVFETPVTTALLLSFIPASWLYPDAPQLLTSVMGAIALIPTVIVLRRLVPPALYPIIYALVLFFFLDRVRAASASVPLASRFLLLFELLGGAGFLYWLIRSTRLADIPNVQSATSLRALRTATLFALCCCVVALVADILGFVGLSTVIGNGVLGSAYAAMVIYAAYRVIESLVMAALRLRPLKYLQSVKRHRFEIWQTSTRILRWMALFAWVLYILDVVALRSAIFQYAGNFLAASLTVGSLSVSLQKILAFIIILWIAFKISKFTRFVLEEEVYQRLGVAQAVAYIISTMLHYAIIVIGLFAAVAALGYDLTKLTILAGAFGVGLGFGLQNIVSNFVSGLIVLLERPVRIGDSIQIGDTTGTVGRIGIRASIIRMGNGSEVIVPNSKFVSDNVINWTFSNRQRLIEVNLVTAHGCKPQQVIEILLEEAKKHPKLLARPEPQAYITTLGPGGLGFKLVAWTQNHEEWVRTRSDLSLAITDALTAAEIRLG